MPREWTLTVDGFGRIEHAEVTVKPLTVLVGPNNSGKSYLGTLIWGVEHGGLNDGEPRHALLHPVVEQWVARALAHEGSWVAWDDTEQHAFRARWPTHVGEVLPEFCRLLFDVKGLRPNRLHVGAPGLETTWYAAIASRGPWGLDDGRPWVLIANHDTPVPAEPPKDALEWGRPLDRKDPAKAFANTVLAYAYMAGHPFEMMTPEYHGSSAVFLPASRTGFSLFYPTFLQATLAGTLTQTRIRPSPDGEGTRPSARFTLPQVHLLSGLVSAFGGQRGPYADEADRLERESLDGIIVVRAETGVARYSFRPDGATEDLGLQLSSALVTELMPLIVVLRYAQKLPFLVVEEPEAHLHPRLQRAVTRCLCRLVRRGVRVLVTTHSTTVAQQINNLIKLGDVGEFRRSELQRRYGYEETEYLEGDEVAVHEFRFLENRRAVVDRLERGVGGYAMPTFNDDLDAFGEETLAFNAVLEPEDEDGQ